MSARSMGVHRSRAGALLILLSVFLLIAAGFVYTAAPAAATNAKIKISKVTSPADPTTSFTFKVFKLVPGHCDDEHGVPDSHSNASDCTYHSGHTWTPGGWSQVGTAELKDGGSQEFTVGYGTYKVEETLPSAGWVQTSSTCTGEFTLSNGANDRHCDFINTYTPPQHGHAHLTVIKTVINDNGGTAVAGNWMMNVDAFGTSSDTSFAGVGSPGTTVNISAGAFSVDESAGGPSGYSKSLGAGCLGTAVDGGSYTCTINNDDIPASLELVKTVDNSNGGTAVAGDWTLTATGPTTLSGPGGAGPTPVPAGAYRLTESVGPSGYTPGTWSCTDGTLGTGADSNLLTLSLGDSAICTISNASQKATLIVIKEVVGGNLGPSDFGITVFGDAEPVPGSFNGQGDPGTTVVILAGEQYDVMESSGRTYYAVTYSPGCFAFDGIAAGTTATCTITNTYIPATLTLVKSVSGGSRLPSEWTLTASGPTFLSGAGGVAATPVTAGTYTLGETGPTDYTADLSWGCTGTGSFTPPNSIALDHGESAVCTISNTVNPATLTLVKTVDNSNGGTAVAADWLLTATGPTTMSGQGGAGPTPVPAGTYTLSESGGPSGYTAGIWSCVSSNPTNGGTGGGSLIAGAVLSAVDSVTLAPGESKVCTINNASQKASLELVKSVSGGSRSASEWTLTASGPTFLSGAGGVAATPVAAGTYTLGETGPTDYTADPSWGCTGTGSFTPPNSIALDPGESAVCTISNTVNPATLTLVKTVIGGSRLPSEWTLTASGATPLSGAGGVAATPVTAGTYTLGETGPTDYSAGSWGCTGTGSFTPPNSIALDPGDSAVCTISNTEKGHIVVEKVTFPSGSLELFHFHSATPVGNFDLTDAEDPHSFEVAPGTYTVSEIEIPIGWDLTGIVCDDGASVVPSVGSAPTATFNVEPGETVKCTFTNTKRGQIKVIKVTDPVGSSQTFDFDPSWLADGVTFPLTGATGSNEYLSDLLPAGSGYSVTETVPAGWAQISAGCVVSAPPGQQLVGDSPVTNPSNIIVMPGQVTTCTFNNLKLPAGSLTIIKDASPTDGTVFNFDAGATLGTFNLNDPNHASEVFTGLSAGSYTISELTLPASSTGVWKLTDINCTGAAEVLYNIPGQSVMVYLARDGIAICTFSNLLDPTAFTVVKEVTSGSEATMFGFDAGSLGTFSIDGQAGTNSKSFTYLAEGAYSVNETVMPPSTVEGFEWSFQSVECRDIGGAVVASSTTSPLVNLNLVDGQHVTCTYRNYLEKVEPPSGALTIVKVVTAGPPATTFDFTPSANLEGGAVFSLNGVAGTNSKAFGNLAAGKEYTVNETGMPTVVGTGKAWFFESVECLDAAGAVVVPKQTSSPLVKVTLTEGQLVTCTYKNYEQKVSAPTGAITIIKETDPAGGTGFTFTPSDNLGPAFTLDDGESMALWQLEPGTYVVTESGTGAWDFHDVVCDAVDYSHTGATVTINLTDGELVTCTFTNTGELPFTGVNGMLLPLLLAGLASLALGSAMLFGGGRRRETA
jgi:hypothetical protein